MNQCLEFAIRGLSHEIQDRNPAVHASRNLSIEITLWLSFARPIQHPQPSGKAENTSEYLSRPRPGH